VGLKQMTHCSTDHAHTLYQLSYQGSSAGQAESL